MKIWCEEIGCESQGITGIIILLRHQTIKKKCPNPILMYGQLKKKGKQEDIVNKIH